MKKKLYISTVASTAIISTVLILLPYKRYTPVRLFGGVGSPTTESIFDMLRGAFEGDYVSYIYSTLIFLTIFFPVLLFPELSMLSRYKRLRFVFPVQGFIISGAAYVLFRVLTLGMFESDTEYYPAFYCMIVWIFASVVFSFLLFFRKIRESVERFLNLRSQPQQLELI